VNFRPFDARPNQSIAVGDLNGDGKLDLAVANEANVVGVLLGNGDGTFGSPATYGAGIYPGSVVVADFTGSGSLDIAVANSGSSNVSILLNGGCLP
jgi:hypothetical protein